MKAKIALLLMLWVALPLRAAVTVTNWPNAATVKFVFVENNADDNFFVTPSGVLDPRMTGANKWTGLKYGGTAPFISRAWAMWTMVITPACRRTTALTCGWKMPR
jgi:hypothetical protein